MDRSLDNSMFDDNEMLNNSRILVPMTDTSILTATPSAGNPARTTQTSAPPKKDQSGGSDTARGMSSMQHG